MSAYTSNVKMKFCALCFISLLISLVSSCGSNNSKSNFPLTVHFKYEEPINGYRIAGEFFPFSEHSETGQVVLRFTSITGGQDFVYTNVGESEVGYPENPAKFTGYNICEYIFVDENARFNDGDTLVFRYNTEPGILKDSPLYYYAEFQFFDVDFDGVDEFLVSDYYRGKGGNNYTVYEIGSEGLELKSFTPFNLITNSTVFDADRRVITNEVHDGVFASEYTAYKIAPDGNTASELSHKEERHN